MFGGIKKWWNNNVKKAWDDMRGATERDANRKAVREAEASIRETRRKMGAMKAAQDSLDARNKLVRQEDIKVAEARAKANKNSVLSADNKARQSVLG